MCPEWLLLIYCSGSSGFISHISLYLAPDPSYLFLPSVKHANAVKCQYLCYLCCCALIVFFLWKQKYIYFILNTIPSFRNRIYFVYLFTLSSSFRDNLAHPSKRRPVLNSLKCILENIVVAKLCWWCHQYCVPVTNFCTLLLCIWRPLFLFLWVLILCVPVCFPSSPFLFYLLLATNDSHYSSNRLCCTPPPFLSFFFFFLLQLSLHGVDARCCSSQGLSSNFSYGGCPCPFFVLSCA